MLDFSFGELALIVLVALLIVGPKDLPVVMRAIGRWMGQFKGITNEFRQGFKSAMEHTGLDGIEKDIHGIHQEVRYIRDQQGNLQRTYDISDFLEHENQAKISSSTPDTSK